MAGVEEDFHQPLGGTGGPLQVAPHLGQRADAAGHDGGVEHEGRQLAGAEAPGQHVVAADPQDEGDGAEHQHHAPPPPAGPVGDALAGGGEAGFHQPAEACRSASSWP
jgi:hypothetical protein